MEEKGKGREKKKLFILLAQKKKATELERNIRMLEDLSRGWIMVLGRLPVPFVVSHLNRSMEITLSEVFSKSMCDEEF